MDENIKTILLNMLLKLDEVCERHGLRYYIAYGTCIGALRHQGVIPWDSDIDVLMPIADAKKLVQYQGEFGERYFVQCKDTDPEFGTTAYRLRDSETACIWNEYRDCRFNQGLDIDIYPYYEAPLSRSGLLLNIWRSHLLRLLTMESMPMHHGGLFKIMKKVVLAFLSTECREGMRKKLQEKLERENHGKEILTYFGEDISFCSAITYPKDWFAEPKKLLFEGHLVNAPTEPEKYLTKRYGDYMTPPPKEKRKNSFDQPGAIIDTTRSYREYYKEMDANYGQQ